MSTVWQNAAVVGAAMLYLRAACKSVATSLMPSLATYRTASPVKILVMGHTGTGKTSLLASLLRAGYFLAIADLENKMAAFAQFCEARGLGEQMARQTDVQTLTQSYGVATFGNTPQLGIHGAPSVWPQFQHLLGNWPGAGPIEAFGPEVVLVIDSFSELSQAVYLHMERINVGSRTGEAHGLQVTGKAQDALDGLLKHLTAASVRCNIVIIGHIAAGAFTEFATGRWWMEAPGKALGPKIPRRFDWVVQTEAQSVPGQRAAYVVHTAPRPGLDLKVPGGNVVPAVISSDIALAALFEIGRGEPGPSGLSVWREPQAWLGAR